MTFDKKTKKQKNKKTKNNKRKKIFSENFHISTKFFYAFFHIFPQNFPLFHKYFSTFYAKFPLSFTFNEIFPTFYVSTNFHVPSNIFHFFGFFYFPQKNFSHFRISAKNSFSDFFGNFPNFRILSTLPRFTPFYVFTKIFRIFSDFFSEIFGFSRIFRKFSQKFHFSKKFQLFLLKNLTLW